MPEHLQPPRTPAAADSNEENGGTPRRVPSRSPHPYHRLNFELLEPSNRFAYRPSIADPFPSFAKESPTASESGTEADDEHFLKGLPAPRARLHKGLRGKNEPLSGTSTPMLSPAVVEEDKRQTYLGQEKKIAAERARRRKELVRRATEVLLLVCQGAMVASNTDVQPFLRLHQKELLAAGGLLFSLAAVYPLRLVLWTYRHGTPSKAIPIRIPASFDPAPLLYPPLVPVLISLLVAQNVEGVVLPSIVLGICALPRALIPGARYWEYLSCSHWLLSCLPFTLHRFTSAAQPLGEDEIPSEFLVLLYPLHQTLCLVLHHLTTTSLLISELHLLSASLISLFLVARSPQAVILKAILWGGGLGLSVFCGHVIQWGISLARVPKWRFRRVLPTKSMPGFWLLGQFLPFSRTRSKSRAYSYNTSGSDHSADECLDGLTSVSPKVPKMISRADSVSDAEVAPSGPASPPDVQVNGAELPIQTPARRHTIPFINKPDSRSKTNTTSGRRRRAASSSVRAFFSLTQTQATIRKWLYAIYVYLCILLVILGGIRSYVQHYALAGNEPIGWALGYLLGELPDFRFQVVKANLERWICLPPRLVNSDGPSCTTLGWANHVRTTSLGQANTRLFLSAYWLAVIVTGLAIVFRLSPVYEVDTRRKVFHFMMVAMFLPTVYIDPAYVALALSLVLAIFLLLDLLRASQLPPLSRPIARFLAPYVDGRDLRGPVVISHIFLLIGCAIPLWLSMASLPRTAAAAAAAGGGVLDGWEVPAREVAMVAGVVCVGLGDAAASLVGRRWGRSKWVWGGGKSLEGSLAFAVAVLGGLMAAAVWLRLGGWPVASADVEVGDGSGMDSLMSVLDLGRLWPWLRVEVPKATACASLASLTEAVLTGGNDNVIVPVVLWGCVKSLGV